MKRYFSLFLILLPQILYAATDPQINFLVMADVHFSPYIACQTVKQKPCPLIAKLRSAPATEWRRILSENDTALPAYRQESNFVLLSSALNAVKDTAAKEDAKFVLVLGDMISHNYRHDYKVYSLDKSRSGYESFVTKTFSFLNQELASAFPTTDVYMIVGNNDSFHRDYDSQPNGLFFKKMAVEWSNLVKSPVNRNQLRQEFPIAGYYAVDAPTDPNLRLIALNTVLFSNKALGTNIAKAADTELKWLHQELEKARQRNQHVIIAIHIPEAIDIYTSMRIRLLRVTELWMADYTARFQAEVKVYAPEIAGIFAGHLHANWIHMLHMGDLVDVPYVGTGSISPIFGNDPGFRLFRLSTSDYHLEDFVTYHHPLKPDAGWMEAKLAEFNSTAKT